VSEMGALVSSV